MSRRETLILRVAAGWTVFIWAFFVRNLLRDDTHALGFKLVHLTLAVVSVAFAVAIWRIATRSSRRLGDRAGTHS